MALERMKNLKEFKEKMITSSTLALEVKHGFKNLMIVMIFILFSCQTDGGKKDSTFVAANGSLLKISYYDNGIKKSEQSYNSNSVLNGESIFYFPNGEKKLVKHFVAGKKENATFGYYESGNLEYIGLYNNDLEDSTWVWYYDSKDMKLNTVENYQRGKLFGGQIEFDTNGYWKWYKLYSLEGLLGSITMSEQKVETNGKLFYSVFNKSELKKGEDFEWIYFVATPPGFDSDIFVDIKHQNKITQYPKKHFKNSAFRNTNRYIFNLQFPKTGAYSLNCKLQILDEEKLKIYKDSVEIEIMVK